MSLEHKNHSVSGASVLATQLHGRDVFEQKGPLENYHLFFEDIVPGTFPILLIGDWAEHSQSINSTGVNILEENDYILNAVLEKITKDHPQCCIIIMNDGKGKYDIVLFRRKSDDELPLILTEPIHSTATIRWEQIGEVLKFTDETKRIQKKIGNTVSNISANIIP